MILRKITFTALILAVIAAGAVAAIDTHTGDRVWTKDANHSSDYYYWTPQTFSGFYYDLDNNVGGETINITNIKGTIDEGDINYTTSPQLVDFQFEDWGQYEVIGFMADKYFAGYRKGAISDEDKSVSKYGQLHRVLLDEDLKGKLVSEGSILALKDGYALEMIDVDSNARVAWISILKNGNEVASDVVEEDETYVYKKKKLGRVSDLPIIAVHFSHIFGGRERAAMFVDGIFQISEEYKSIDVGDEYGVMEIKSKSGGTIRMENKDSIDLDPGEDIPLMGDLVLRVADNSTLRFAPYVNRSGVYEVRGTVLDNQSSFTWTPYNFEGFYYDLDEDVGTEKFNVSKIEDRNIPEGGITYTTTAKSVSFQFKDWGKYQVIGFLADKYFAGYLKGNITDRDISTSDRGQLHRVLIDDDSEHTVDEGSFLALKDGYALKMVDVDVNDRRALVYLLKDGTVIDQPDVVNEGDTYTYEKKKVGSVSDLPIIAVHFSNVFGGRERAAMFVDGIFQISESYTEINTGDEYGTMEIKSKSGGVIRMENKENIDLDAGTEVEVMGDMKFKIADNETVVRFYPFKLTSSTGEVTDTGAPDISRLEIDAPSFATERDNITITVKVGNIPIRDVNITLDGQHIGFTDRNGTLHYTLTKKGTYTIRASREGYDDGTKTITVEEYIAGELILEMPSRIDQGKKMTIVVSSNGTGIEGVALTFDDVPLGTTNASGMFEFTPEVGGNHTIKASKENYVGTSKNLEVIPPYSRFEVVDLNLTPLTVYTGKPAMITVNVTNTGTKGGSHKLELKVNGSTVESKNITLSPGEFTTVTFNYTQKTPANYILGVDGKTATLSVVKKPFFTTLNIILLAVLVTGIGAAAVYLITRKEGGNIRIRRSQEAGFESRHGRPREGFRREPEEIEPEGYREPRHRRRRP